MSEEPATAWEGFGAAELARRWGAPEVHLFQSVGSTNDVARRLGGAGAPVGTVVLAEEQVVGRGRAGRQWASPPGVGLWFSVVAGRDAEQDVAVLPLIVGVAVARALDQFLAGGEVGIKWPNDLHVGEGKLGGILCEGTWDGPRRGVVVAGVGLNLLQRLEDFPAEVRERATSLRMAARSEVSRLAVAERVLGAVVRAVRQEVPLDLATLRRKDLVRGSRVVITDPMTGAPLLHGVARGIAPDGALIVRDPGGVERAVRSGTVRVEG